MKNKKLPNTTEADIINMMNNCKNDEKKIAEAKEKLSCHIAHDAHAASAASAAPAEPVDFIDEKGNILLTRMTDAGG
ncbi:MAG: hypothetical protein IKE52_06820 [Mogibacterium sp.]|nr:hypothetical protein [Mogibacterium sp.]